MTQTLNVEYDELMARAQELEQPMPLPPSENPRPPCALPFVGGAATQLMLSADSLRLYLGACEREWRRLAQSLRNAALAYEQVDEEAAESITNDSSMAGGNGSMMAFCDPDEDWGGWVPPPPPPPPPPVEVPYYEVRQAATDIEAPDQGTAFNAFAKEWDTFQRDLQTTTFRFRPFTSWEGMSATLVEANFAAHRTWVYQVAQLCSTLSAQAKAVPSTQKWAITAHPSSYEVSEADKWYLIYKTDPYYKNNPNTPYYLSNIMQWYADMQAKSEEVLAEYVRRAALPLQPVYPTPPPSAHRIDPPPKPDNPDNPDNPDDPSLPDEDDPGLPDDDYGDTPATPSTPSTPSMPSTPTTPSTGVPPLSDEFKDALANAAALQGADPSLKPASVGGGGGGGLPGGGGIPPMPMQPSVGAESVAPSGAGGRDAANAARGMPGAGGGMGGPMGGMPMGGGAGAGQGNNKEGKRGPEADQTLYEEDRPWTEAVIGNRRRKDAPEK